MALTQEERVNLVIHTLKVILRTMISATGLVCDGVVGPAAMAAVAELRRFLSDGFLSENQINHLTLALKAADFNDALIADGVAGEQFQIALDNFLALYGK